MSLKRRLNNLECRPRISGKKAEQQKPPGRDLQKKLNLPLPAQRTEDEFNEASRIFSDAIERLKVDQLDTSGLDDMRDYAGSLHEKYAL